MDLSTLDPTQPPGTQAVSLGDDRIRETREAVVNSFGVEHHLTGEHKLAVGTDSLRPAAGHFGRPYVNTQYGRMELDNGSAWLFLHAAQSYSAGAAGPITVGGSLVDLVSLSLNTGVGGDVFCWGEFEVASGVMTVTYRITYDGTPIRQRGFNISGVTGITMPLSVMTSIIAGASGDHVLRLQASNSSGNTIAQNIALHAIVI